MQALYICLFNPYKGKDRKGEVLAQNVQKSGFEMAKCDKHSRKQGIVFRRVFVQGQSSARQRGQPFSPRHRQLELLLQKHLRTKLTRQLMRTAWRTETMVLPDQKVAITEQSRFKSYNQVIID